MSGRIVTAPVGSGIDRNPPAANTGPMDLAQRVTATAQETGFSGVVRVDRGADCLLDLAFGLADRAHGVANTTATRFGMASGSKFFTALAILGLVGDGRLALDTTARSVLGADLTRLDGRVTVRQLLSHTSGIGEYLDDDADPADYLLPGGMQDYPDATAMLPLLDQPMRTEPGTRFEYSNAAFVLLGVLIERLTRTPFQEAVTTRVLEPAGLTATGFLRSDELPGDAAIGYLWPDRPRSNVFHLPIRGSADGGAYTTTADLLRFWAALSAGRVVDGELLALATTPAPGHDPAEPYGLGVWLPVPGAWVITGADAGVSMQSEHQPGRGLTWSVLSNDSEGAWPVVRLLRGWSRG